MKKVADYMFKVSEIIKDFEYSDNKEERIDILKKFREFIKNNEELKNIRNEVEELCNKFPIYK